MFECLNFLPECDKIIVLQNGAIRKIGTFDQLKKNKGDFYQFIGNKIKNFQESNENKTRKIFLLIIC